MNFRSNALSFTTNESARAENNVAMVVVILVAPCQLPLPQ
jgi:hypothetical protein